MKATATTAPDRTAAATRTQHHNHGENRPTILADEAPGVEVPDADNLAAALAAFDEATGVVVTTTSTTGVERTRRVVCLTLAGAEATVARALARGHRATAVVVRLVPLGAIR